LTGDLEIAAPFVEIPHCDKKIRRVGTQNAANLFVGRDDDKQIFGKSQNYQFSSRKTRMNECMLVD
jgi:hypothetical protein